MPHITITLPDNEALVLFDLLSRYVQSNLLGTEDQAEQRALWNLQSLLEPHIVAVFSANYQELIAAARDAIRNQEGTNANAEADRGKLAFWLDSSDIAFLVDQWRKMPNDLQDAERQQWADISFRGMSALHKFGIKYTGKPTTTCYKEVPRRMTEVNQSR
jgi:hypothetical protein